MTTANPRYANGHRRRNTTIRDRHRRTIARGKPPCGICSQTIDYTLPHTDPQSYVVDHILPLSKGGTDTIDNKQAAHRACNGIKSNTLAEDQTSPPRVFVTSLTW